MPKPKSKNPNSPKKQEAHNRSTSIGGDVTDSVVISGDGNQTTFQKIINIFKGESESTDHRNRRVMLNHVDEFWVKGILEKSLHGVALLELGIKEDPTAVNYPWRIKKTSTDENLPDGKSMLEIFKEIGLGRSLLILGAPGSGKTTMLLKLTSQLIDLARKDKNEPIPVVFNLSSWTEKLTLADWLAEQLNTFYYVPKKTAQKLVTENKMFLLLDGLDEVEEELREKCVNAINEFKNGHGLTSFAICSRIEEYQALQTKLALAGAITLQPLTSEQVDAYFNKFGKSLSSLKGILKKDKTLRELTETPLMLSIMVLAYKDVNIKDIPELKNSKEQSKHLFDIYINRMFERRTRSEKKDFSKAETLNYLSWLAYQMVGHNRITYQIELMQPSWLRNEKQQRISERIVNLSFGLLVGLIVGAIFGLISGLTDGLLAGLIDGLIGLSFGLLVGLINVLGEIKMIDELLWSWRNALFNGFVKFAHRRLVDSLNGMKLIYGLTFGAIFGLIFVLIFGLISLICMLIGGGLKDYGLYIMYMGLVVGLFGGLYYALVYSLVYSSREKFDMRALIEDYELLTLRLLLTKYKVLPKRLVPFLDSCVDLIFLRRVGGSYIFVHRLLMEHFAEVYVEKEIK